MPARLILSALLFAVLPAVARGEGPMKALIVDGQNNHNWKETTPILKQQLEETGLFTVDVATTPEHPRSSKGQPAAKVDMSGFQPKFSDYQVVVLNYTGDPWPESTQKAFVDYVAGGGGVVVYHAADNAFPEWKEFNEIIGVGGWGGRNEKSGPYVRWRDGKVVYDTTPGPGGSHGPQHEFQIVVRDANHPITKGLPPVFMHSADELYNRLRGPAKNLSVLATAFSPADKRGSGEHEPMLMTIGYGKGRVFHTAFGHAGAQIRSVSFIATFQRGAEWAATGKVTQKVPADMPGPDKPVVRQ